MDAVVKHCEHCNQAVSEIKRGRPQRFCSDRCRQAHRKIAPTRENGLRYRTGRPKPKSGLEGIEVAAEFKPENPSPKTDLSLSNVRRSTRSPSRLQMAKSPTWLPPMGSGVAIGPPELSLGSLSSHP